MGRLPPWSPIMTLRTQHTPIFTSSVLAIHDRTFFLMPVWCHDDTIGYNGGDGGCANAEPRPLFTLAGLSNRRMGSERRTR